MTEQFYSKKMHDGSWVFAVVLGISSGSGHVTNKRLAELLMEFGEYGCSYELLFENGGLEGLQWELIIRKNGYDPGWLREHFTGLLETLRGRLKYEGISIIPKNRQETDGLLERLNTRSNMHLCIPGRERQDFKLCYILGGYIHVERLELDYILSVLEGAAQAGLSLQFNSTILLDTERQRITENIDWLQNTYGNMPEAQQAIKNYQFYLSMAREKIFFVCVSFWGNEEVTGRLAHSVRCKGYESMRIPSEIVYKRDYLAEGAQLLTKYATVIGHEKQEGVAMPQGFERLDYLATPYVVDKFVNISDSEDDGSENRRNKSEITRVPDGFLDMGGLALGTACDVGERVFLPLQQLNRHMTIAGMSGYGKTTLLFQLLIECKKKAIPFLIVEPTKTEHRELMDVIPELKIYTPGKTEVSPVMFNPFLPPEGVTLEQFLPSLISAFQLAFSMTTPLDVIFSEAVRNCYAQYGWRGDSTRDSEGVTQFGMHEFICAFKEEINRSSYDYESKQNLNSGGVYRLQGLINNNPYLFDTDRTMDFGQLLNGYTLIELDAIDNQEQKSLFMSMLLLQLKLVIRQTQSKDSRLKNIILIDEAHVLLDHAGTVSDKQEADPSGKIEDYLLDMVKVNRVYGTGMVFADQSLAILKSFVNQSNIKVAMHLESHEERDFLMNNLNLAEELYRRIAKLKIGQFYVSCELLDAPLLVQMEDVRQRYPIPSDVSDAVVADRMKQKQETPFASCPCKEGCNARIRNEADFIARNVCNTLASSVRISEKPDEAVQAELDAKIAKIAAGYDDELRLKNCARLMTERMLRRRAALAEELE